MNTIPLTFFRDDNVVELSRKLLGKHLMTEIDGRICGGMITETEAYNGIQDKASHAYGGRRTKRTEIMYANGGVAYVYLCYGIHHLFNIVTNISDIPHAILIRSIVPTDGIAHMLERRKKQKLTPDICVGPGKVSQALGIHVRHTGTELNSGIIWLEDRDFDVHDINIKATPRIGVDYAGEDAKLLYRFVLDS